MRTRAVARCGGGTPCRLLTPGDTVEGAAVVSRGAARPTVADLRRALREELAEACARLERLTPLSEIAVEALAEAVRARSLEAGAARAARPIEAQVRLRDEPGRAIRLSAGRGTVLVEIGAPEGHMPVLELRSQVLLALLHEPYGSEPIIIGCGAVAQLSRKEELGIMRALLRFLTSRSGPWRSIAAELHRRPVAATRIVVNQRWPLALNAAVRCRPSFTGPRRADLSSVTNGRALAARVGRVPGGDAALGVHDPGQDDSDEGGLGWPRPRGSARHSARQLGRARHLAPGRSPPSRPSTAR